MFFVSVFNDNYLVKCKKVLRDGILIVNDYIVFKILFLKIDIRFVLWMKMGFVW